MDVTYKQELDVTTIFTVSCPNCTYINYQQTSGNKKLAYSMQYSVLRNGSGNARLMFKHILTNDALEDTINLKGLFFFT